MCCIFDGVFDHFDKILMDFKSTEKKLIVQ